MNLSLHIHLKNEVLLEMKHKFLVAQLQELATKKDEEIKETIKEQPVIITQEEVKSFNWNEVLKSIK